MARSEIPTTGFVGAYYCESPTAPPAIPISRPRNSAGIGNAQHRRTIDTSQQPANHATGRSQTIQSTRRTLTIVAKNRARQNCRTVNLHSLSSFSEEFEPQMNTDETRIGSSFADVFMILPVVLFINGPEVSESVVSWCLNPCSIRVHPWLKTLRPRGAAGESQRWVNPWPTNLPEIDATVLLAFLMTKDKEPMTKDQPSKNTTGRCEPACCIPRKIATHVPQMSAQFRVHPNWNGSHHPWDFSIAPGVVALRPRSLPPRADLRGRPTRFTCCLVSSLQCRWKNHVPLRRGINS